MDTRQPQTIADQVSTLHEALRPAAQQLEQVRAIAEQLARQMEPMLDQARQAHEAISRATRGLQAWYGLSNSDLASVTGVPYHTLRRRLIGDSRSDWRADEVLRISIVFDIPLSDLYAGEVNTKDGVLDRILTLLNDQGPEPTLSYVPPFGFQIRRNLRGTSGQLGQMGPLPFDEDGQAAAA